MRDVSETANKAMNKSVNVNEWKCSVSWVVSEIVADWTHKLHVVNKWGNEQVNELVSQQLRES